jgi:HD-GYP domain-containing protein (c-di-GMP phosphodiesterase class II)/PAS domain-containing protein
MTQAAVKISDAIEEEWLRTYKVIDLLGVVLSLQAIFKFWFVRQPLGNIYFASLIMSLVALISALDWWKLRSQHSFWFSPHLMPLTALGMSCLGVWATDPSMFQWVLVTIFLAFVRLPLRAAQVLSLLAVVLSIALMSLDAGLEATVLIRSALSGAISVTLLSVFFKNSQKTALRLSETSALLDAAMQTMSQGIGVIGKNGRFKMANDRACDLLDLPKSLLQNQPLLTEVVKFQNDRGDFGPGLSDVEASARSYVATLGVNVDERVPRRYLRQDRCGRYIEVNTHPMPSGDLVRTYTDVTQYEEVNRQLKVVLDEYQELSEQAMQRGREQIVVALTQLSLIRDNETGLHTSRTRLYVKTLAQALVRAGHYVEQLSDSQIELIAKATPMHDLGKVGIPDHILLKPGRLSDEETQVMRTHAALGESILLVMAGAGQADDSLFTMAAKLAGAHHENWDGSGYPRGLSAQDIPLGARLMALADVYDALTTARVYKLPWNHQAAREEIMKLSGLKLDPLIVAAFRQEEARFVEIAEEFRDQEAAHPVQAAA